MPPATTSGQALQQLQSYQGTEKAPDQILQGQEQALGVPQAQQQVSGLRQAITNTTNLLNQVAPSVYGRTENSLVTDAQATRQIGNEQAPIQTKLGGLNTSYDNANSDLETNLSRAGTLAGLEAQGQTSKESSLKDIYSALYGQEQDAAKMAEQQREADLSASTARATSSGGGIDLGSLIGGLTSGGGSSTPGAQIIPKNGNNGAGGYAFATATGEPIKASQYAHLNNIPLGTLLYQMGNSGDKYAQQAYNTYLSNPDIGALVKKYPLLFPWTITF